MLHSIVIEVRQHLCCANVFFKLKKSLKDSESLKINVDETKVQLQNSHSNIDIFVNKYFLILAGTFSNLIVDTDNAAFRVSIKDIQLEENNIEKDIQNLEQINLKEQQEAAVKCSNCEAVLANSQRYEKIREFPSGGIDVSDFFCHHGPSFKDVLVPTSRDLFYGFQFIVLNKELIEKCTRLKESHLYCKRCLKYLGELIFNGRAAKLWSDSIRLCLQGKILEIFSSNEKSQIHRLLLKVIHETSLPSPEPLLRNIHFTKVLLEASFPNRQQHYLLLHILEKHLPVLRYKRNECEVEGDNTPVDLIINKAFKLFYRLIAQDNDYVKEENELSNSPPLLSYWQQDINILKMKISPFLFKALIDELNTNSENLPEIYRTNNDDFLLSYIFY
ncbi:uncharacterized protein ACRADG_008895 [Cochliomyia hominivorax]